MSELYEWCKTTFPDRVKDCEDKLKDTETEKDLDLTTILSEELQTKSVDEINKEINRKRRYIVDIKRFLESENHLTNERLSQDNKKEINNLYLEMFSLMGLIVLHIFLGIVIIYYLADLINK